MHGEAPRLPAVVGTGTRHRKTDRTPHLAPRIPRALGTEATLGTRSRDHLGADYAEAREVFRQCVPACFASLSTPRYPFIADVQEQKADAGHAVFMETCARCHGDFAKTGPKTYELVTFPNRLVDHEELDTDPLWIIGVFDMSVEERKRFLSGTVTTTHR